jgi:hypothetical protein
MEALYRLLDPSIPVDLPTLEPNQRLPPLDNRDLDKLFTALGRSKATWRRALVLHEWLIQVSRKRGMAVSARACVWWGRCGQVVPASAGRWQQPYGHQAASWPASKVPPATHPALLAAGGPPP